MPEYLIIASTTATIALIWRELLLDHPRLLTFIESIPVAGAALRCGFCFPVWLSLVATLLYNPITMYLPQLSWYAATGVGWMTLSAGVLFIRNSIAVVMEANGVLTHMHRYSHEDE